MLVEQGNLIEENKVDALEINMTKDQVIFLLGEPIVNNIFNKERWDYVYYRKREPEETQLKMVSIFFENNTIVSMKKISKNNDGLFEINEGNEEKPKFTDETVIIAEKIFDDVELEGIKIQNNELSENNKELEFNENEETEYIKKEEEKIALKEKITEMNTKKSLVEKQKSDEDIISEILNNWAKAWEDKNLNEFYAFYIKGYSSRYFNDHEMWKADREKRIKNKSKIEVNLADIKINIISDIRASLIFTQNYSSNNYADTVIKQMKFEKINDEWKIISEELATGGY